MNIIYSNILDLIEYKDKLEYTLMRPSLLRLIIISILILVEGSSLIQEELVESRSIVLSPYLPITFIDPVKKQINIKLINIRIKVNILPE